MRGDGVSRDGLSDKALWRRSRLADADREAVRFLDLAGFADGRLDAGDRERVAASLQGDPEAAGDVAAARAFAAAPLPQPAPEAVVARACSLVGGAGRRNGNVVAFPLRPRRPQLLPGLAQWGSLAAAVAVASWIGFTLGMDTSLSLAQAGGPAQVDQPAFLHDLLDPSTGFMRELPGAVQT